MNVLSKKIEWIDAYRGLGIILVVLGHCIPPFNKIIYGFHMPLFLIISGYLWHNENIGCAVKKYLKKYIVPYFILCFINLVLCCTMEALLYGNTNVCRYLIGILYSKGNTIWMPNCSPLWYLTSLFVSLVLWQCIYKCNKFLRILLIGICFVVSVALDKYNITKLPWNIDTAMMNIVFIAYGYYLRKYLEQKLDICKLKNIMYFFMVAIGIVFIILNPIDKVSFDNNSYGNAVFMLVGAISVCTGLMGGTKTLCEAVPFSFIKFMGKHTVFIMGFDYFAGTIADNILVRVGFYNWVTMFICKLIILATGIIIWNRIVGFIHNDKIRRTLSF